MADRYRQFADSPPGRFVVRRLGLPQPSPLVRGPALLDGPVLLAGAVRARGALERMGVDLRDRAERYAALIFDASRITRTAGLRDVYDFFSETIRELAPSGRLIVIGTGESVAQRALEGFVRSAAKEVRHGATAQLVYAEPDADLESTLRFLLSGRSAYVSGQVVRVAEAVRNVPEDWERPLAGTTAAVTGASRGIGAAIAEVLARDGARVTCIDVPARGQELAAVANAVGGIALQLDVTSDRAPEAIAERGAAIVVHNAGITRDRTLARMSEDEWDAVLAVNLESIERIDESLLARDDVRRIVCVSSVSGIAGNRGQANYATSKAGVIGIVEALAPEMPRRQATINAVAPGFIETGMTAAMPLATREAGRRLSSLAQGGLPVDVAETIAWLASPGSGGVNGNVVRVCGQSLIGA